jgi:hypothetical protein
MGRVVFACVVLIAASFSSALAAGVNLGCDDCAGVGAAPSDKFGTATFSCNSNLNTSQRSFRMFTPAS